MKFWLNLGHDSVVAPYQNVKIPDKCSKYNFDMVTHMITMEYKKFSFDKTDTLWKACILQISHN